MGDHQQAGVHKGEEIHRPLEATSEEVQFSSVSLGAWQAAGDSLHVALWPADNPGCPSALNAASQMLQRLQRRVFVEAGPYSQEAERESETNSIEAAARVTSSEAVHSRGRAVGAWASLSWSAGEGETRV